MQNSHLIGVSIPRAGHHYLVTLLSKVLGDDFSHCEFYTPEGCCRSVPCTKPKGRIFYQKNHDFDLALASNLPGVLYVVQVRDPVHAVLSDREYLAKMDSEARAADRDEYVVWLARKAHYIERFHRKWVQPDIPHRVMVDYDELVDRADHVLARLLGCCGVDVDPARMQKAIAETAGLSASFPARSRTGPFSRRKLETSRFFDAGLLAAFESLLVDRIPAMQGRHHLEKVAYADHPVAHVFFAEEALVAGDQAAALAHIERACALAPGNAHLAMLRVDLLAGAGRFADALSAARAVEGSSPNFPALLRRLSDLCLAGSQPDLARARDYAARLVIVAPDDAGARIHLAFLLLRLNERDAAQDNAEIAIASGTQDTHVWRTASEIFAQCQNWTRAEYAARNAVFINPTIAEFHHHRANVLARLGRMDDAATEHREAIERAPDIPGWRWKWGEDLRSAGRFLEARDVVHEALRRFPADPALVQLARILH